MSRATLLAALLAAAPAAAEAPASGNGTAASVVYVQVFRSPYDWSQPWRQEPVSGASGSGFLIDGGRILTNGHVIADARQVLVRRPDQANPYVATVEAAGNDCDLAVLKVADPAFARGLRPLRFGTLPRAGHARQHLRLPARRPGRLVHRRHRLAHRVARLRAQRRRRAPRGPDGRRDQPGQQRRAGGAGRQGRRRRVPGLPGRRQHGLLHPGPDRAPLPRQPGGRPLRRLPGLGAADGAAPVPGLSPRARPAARTARVSWSTAWRPAGRPRASCARATCSCRRRATRSRTTARSGWATRA